MSTHDFFRRIMGVAVFGIIASPQVPAQDLSAAQSEVWQFIEACNVHYSSEDLEGVLGCFHEDFSGWRYEDTVPRSKTSIANFCRQSWRQPKFSHTT